MFKHEKFYLYDYNYIPLNEECFLMDEKYIPEYEQAVLNSFKGEEYKNFGYISYASIVARNENSLELSWYPNIHDRFHEVIITLSKENLIAYVECPEYSGRSYLFVNSNWLEQLHLKHYSVFAMIDAIGVKHAIQSGSLSKQKLVDLRDAIDILAAKSPDISFISFADSLLLKSNWTVGHFQKNIKYTYRPEIFLYVFQELQSIYHNQLGLNIYGIFTQGSNEYYDDNLLHISSSKNHICLNSLGAPFADLMAIDETVRDCIKHNIHPPCELYMDAQFYHSLNFQLKFDKAKKSNSGEQMYITKMRTNVGSYYYNQCQHIINNLEPPTPQNLRKIPKHQVA